MSCLNCIRLCTVTKVIAVNEFGEFTVLFNFERYVLLKLAIYIH